MIEFHEVQCPCCWETIELAVDTSAGEQEYVEDCQVCCRPLRVRVGPGRRGRAQVRVESDEG